MICLNKADEGSFRHLTYNQCPPALQAGATTRQDLNGMANLREYVAAGQDGASGGSSGGMLGQTAWDEERQRGGGDGGGPEQHGGVGVGVGGSGAGRRPSGMPAVAVPFLRSKAMPENHLVGLSAASLSSSTCVEHLWSWTAWLLSVLVGSYLLSASPSILLNPWAGVTSKGAACLTSGLLSVPDAGLALPKPLLHSSGKRQSTCASSGVAKDQYNTSLHAAALFIIWFVSSLACGFPILAARFPRLRIPRRFFFAVRHFGTGVLIATAFVHLLPTAFTSLANPCLGPFWTKDYQAMPGAIALAAVFLVSVIEMVFHPSRHVPPADVVTRPCESEDPSSSSGGEDKASTDEDGHSTGRRGRWGSLRARKGGGGGLSHLDNGASSSDDIPKDGQVDEEPVSDPASGGTDVHVHVDVDVDVDEETGSLSGLTPEQKRNKERLQCMLLEMGILFHSVFIGMALSVSVGSEFVVLLIAIAFHQTFEGLALGSRIAVIEWDSSKTWQPWLMAFAYGCTTPIGQAIGLATHTLYSPDSEVGLILVGVMNAISAGLLTFASLVELLAEDFLSDESWRFLRGGRRVVAFVLVLLGAFFMALVGAWA